MRALQSIPFCTSDYSEPLKTSLWVILCRKGGNAILKRIQFRK
jgi:hypothetical protein